MTRLYDYLAAATDLAAAAGVGVTLVKTRRHPRLVLHHNGASRFVVVPSTPSDGRRGILRARADVRKELRILQQMTPTASPGDRRIV
jgi:hypothetical protein